MHTRLLWVCGEDGFNSPTAAFSPDTLAVRIARYTKPGGYLSKLIRKLHDVQANSAAAARLLDVPDPDRHWLIHPLKITRQGGTRGVHPHPGRHLHHHRGSRRASPGGHPAPSGAMTAARWDDDPRRPGGMRGPSESASRVRVCWLLVEFGMARRAAG